MALAATSPVVIVDKTHTGLMEEEMDKVKEEGEKEGEEEEKKADDEQQRTSLPY